MVRPLVIATLILAATMVLGVSSAFAYDEAEPPSGRTCVQCHGVIDPADPEQQSRTGPHGGYTTTTQKCQVCHSVHQAPASGFLLLPGATIKEVCESCHDGTGGSGVYGVIEARTGMPALSAHSIETTRLIPGGNPDGTDRDDQMFSGPGGTLTCTDCHSPHGNTARTVEPFFGDRYRTDITSDTAYATIPSDRLLRRAPTGAETSVTVYGAGWCATCHQGRRSGSGGVLNHPVQQDDYYYYDRLPVLKSNESSETTIGRLGQSNLGYRMPDLRGGETTRTPLQTESPGPLCQQCHEDVRDATQEFVITAPDGGPDDSAGGSTDNPRFQVFPHESNARSLLLVLPGDTAPYRDELCLNCHLN